MCNFSAGFCVPSVYTQESYSNQMFIGAVTTIRSQRTILVTGLLLNATASPTLELRSEISYLTNFAIEWTRMQVSLSP
jgi:hypothetical protein